MRALEQLDRDKAELAELEKPFVERARGYTKRTGPGLLQSAMTLGVESATASVVAGAPFGYKLLWVQPVAMFLGVMMLAALGRAAVILKVTAEDGTVGWGQSVPVARWSYEMLETAADVLKEPFVVKDATIEVPRGPGLGIEVDEEKVRELVARTAR